MEDKGEKIIDIIKILIDYEKEERKSTLSGMAWEDVSHNIYNLKNDYGYSDEKLKELFPSLCIIL